MSISKDAALFRNIDFGAASFEMLIKLLENNIIISVCPPVMGPGVTLFKAMHDSKIARAHECSRLDGGQLKEIIFKD